MAHQGKAGEGCDPGHCTSLLVQRTLPLRFGQGPVPWLRSKS
jgi:hypothetical protein